MVTRNQKDKVNPKQHGVCWYLVSSLRLLHLERHRQLSKEIVDPVCLVIRSLDKDRRASDRGTHSQSGLAFLRLPGAYPFHSVLQHSDRSQDLPLGECWLAASSERVSMGSKFGLGTGVGITMSGGQGLL